MDRFDSPVLLQLARHDRHFIQRAYLQGPHRVAERVLEAEAARHADPGEEAPLPGDDVADSRRSGTTRGKNTRLDRPSVSPPGSASSSASTSRPTSRR